MVRRFHSTVYVTAREKNIYMFVLSTSVFVLSDMKFSLLESFLAREKNIYMFVLSTSVFVLSDMKFSLLESFLVYLDPRSLESVEEVEDMENLDHVGRGKID